MTQRDIKVVVSARDLMMLLRADDEVAQARDETKDALNAAGCWKNQYVHLKGLVREMKPSGHVLHVSIEWFTNHFKEHIDVNA